MSDTSMSTAQIVTVDVRQLGLGMSHAFQGMAEVCASLGVPQGDLLKATNGAADEQGKSESSSGTRRGKGERRMRMRQPNPILDWLILWAMMALLVWLVMKG